jgi:predicted O-methyltransferase YrrM
LTRRVRRFLGRHVAGPRLRRTRAELADTHKQLKKATKQLASARTELQSARLAADIRRLSDDVEAAITGVRADNLTFLKPPALRDLAAVMTDIERNEIPGLVVETGTALGGSAIVIAAAKDPARPMKVYDVFGMIPEPGENDGDDVHERYRTITSGQAKGRAGETYYGYREDLYGEVTESFSRLGVPLEPHHVELIQGLFQDTVHLDEPVALAHLDGDWYDSTMVCLERIAPLVVPGGRIVLDDYEAWSGCRRAVDEYFHERDGWRFEQHSRLHVVRA